MREMLKAQWLKYNLKFKQAATTSREVLLEKPTYFVRIVDTDCPDVFGIGECALFHGLSCDDVPSYETRLTEFCRKIGQIKENGLTDLIEFPSIRFGIETALADLNNGGRGIVFPSAWTEGLRSVKINGLIWMGRFDEMLSRLDKKLKEGFHYVKFKIGGIDFENELELIRQVRNVYPVSAVEIRLDANGAFGSDVVLKNLDKLSRFDIHSIEQPVRQRQWKLMRNVIQRSPIPIALDEELIGLNTTVEKCGMLEALKPHYIILKPSLCGGINGSEEWVELAGNFGVGWWATSALESNIGLNAIAQWVATKNPEMVQGLGTGELFTNNIPSPIRREGEWLRYDSNYQWDYSSLKWNE